MFANIRNCVVFKQCAESSSQLMLNFGDFQVLLMKYILNFKVEIVSNNIILEKNYF